MGGGPPQTAKAVHSEFIFVQLVSWRIWASLGHVMDRQKHCGFFASWGTRWLWMDRQLQDWRGFIGEAPFGYVATRAYVEGTESGATRV